MSEVLVLVDHVDGQVRKTTSEMLTLAARLGEPSAVVIGDGADAATEALQRFGAQKIYQVSAADLDGLRPETTTAGRILAIRTFGKANFLVLSDGVNRIQAYIRQDSVPERDFAVFKLLDFGDFVGVQGRVFRTKTNELTIWASGLTFPASSRCPRCCRA